MYAIAILLLAALTPALFALEDPVIKAMKDEMERAKSQLRAGEMVKPYYLQYRIDDSTTTSISATLGVLTGSSTTRGRALTLQVRTGDYSLDNTNFLTARSFGRTAAVRFLPLDDDYDQIRREIWLATDQAYKEAAREFAAKRTVLETRKYGAYLPDFTPQPPIAMLEPRREIKADRKAAEALARDVAAVFRGAPDIIESGVDIVIRDLYTRFLNSEGTVFTRSEPMVAVRVHAGTRAADGMPVRDSFSVSGRSMEEIKTDGLVERAKSFVAGLLALRSAPTLERYNGPVLFEGVAGGQVLAEVFAPAIAAARFPVTDEPQFETAIPQLFAQMGGTPLTDKLGGRVMPEFLDLSDHPHLAKFEGVTLLGSRTMDDEGVPTRDLNIVEAGILKTVLATRTPTVEAKTSTGSKGVFGAVPCNLFLDARKSQSAAELRQHLLRLAKARGSDFGIVIRGASEGALSWAARFAAAAGAAGGLNDVSVAVFKLFPDGREERVRGVEISSLTPVSFKDIVAVGDKQVLYQGPHVPTMNAIFAGFGAGNVGGDLFAFGSFVAPSILFEEVSLKKANMPVPNPPVVPSPLLSSFTQNGK
ncbi:MAG: metallopeptidase TldD-related protein [Terriglobales bacterium]